MKIVKVFWVSGSSYYDDNGDYQDSNHILISTGVEDWEEISDQSYSFLSQYLNRIYNKEGLTPLLIVKPEKSVEEAILSVNQMIAKYNADAELRLKKAQDAKNKKAEKSRELNRKLLERLKKEFGET